jgi:hypothetical protein
MLQEVQGHIAQADIDPGAATPWLRVREGVLCPTPGAGVALKRVFNPFDWHLRHYRTAAPGAAQGAGNNVRGVQSLADRSKSHICGSTSGAAAGSGGDEVRRHTQLFCSSLPQCMSSAYSLACSRAY